MQRNITTRRSSVASSVPTGELTLWQPMASVGCMGHQIGRISILPPSAPQRIQTKGDMGLKKLFELKEDRPANNPDLISKRTQHAQHQADQNAKQIQERLSEESGRDATRSAMNANSDAIADLRARVRKDLQLKKHGGIDIAEWDTERANAFWSACDRSDLTAAKAAADLFISQAWKRQFEVTQLKSEMSALGANIGTWASFTSLSSAQCTQEDEKWDTTLSIWKSSVSKLEAMAKTVTDSLNMETPQEAEVNDAAKALKERLDGRATDDDKPKDQIEMAEKAWNPLKKLLKPLYMAARDGINPKDQVADLILRTVTHGLVVVTQTQGPYKNGGDAKGAKGFKDVGLSTIYTLDGLGDIEVHVHWAKDKVGTQVAQGDNPAHWKRKAHKYEPGSNISTVLAKLIHSKALNKKEK